MAIEDDLRSAVQTTFKSAWTTRDGTVVPTTEGIKLSNDGICLDATVIYADLSESTRMVDNMTDEFAAEVYKNYLYCAGRLIRYYNGSITAYDGDRVMGVFIGDAKNTNAVRCALALNWTVEEVIRPELKAVYSSSDFTVRHTVGIDSSELLVARTGVRGDNDLVWVGRAANWAAKLTNESNLTPLWITKRVYDRMHQSVKTTDAGVDMWNLNYWSEMNYEAIYCSSYQWQP